MFENTGEARKFRAYYALGMYAVAIVVAVTSQQMKSSFAGYLGIWDTFAIWYAVAVGTALFAYNGITHKKYLASL